MQRSPTAYDLMHMHHSVGCHPLNVNNLIPLADTEVHCFMKLIAQRFHKRQCDCAKVKSAVQASAQLHQSKSQPVMVIAVLFNESVLNQGP